MRVTQAHIAFWRAKKSPRPGWFGRVAGYYAEAVPSIHTLINSHAGIKFTAGEMQAHNTLVILRMRRKRGGLKEPLARMAERPETIINPLRREGFCAKWLTKLEQTK